jgi:hypothetical protein
MVSKTRITTVIINIFGDNEKSIAGRSERSGMFHSKSQEKFSHEMIFMTWIRTCQFRGYQSGWMKMNFHQNNQALWALPRK